MGDVTAISWTNRTMNFWVGCKKVSEGCRECYMFREQERYGNDPTHIRRTKTWAHPLKWQREAAKSGVKELVFTCSWSDFFIEESDPWRAEAWAVIKSCPNLIFQVLTKRPERIAASLPEDWNLGYPNVALGVSVETSKYFSRMDILREIPAALRFVSAEPLLGSLKDIDLSGYGWLIAGGESGPNFRNMDLDWTRELRDVCKSKNVPFFYKQASDLLPGKHFELDGIVHYEFPAEWTR